MTQVYSTFRRLMNELMMRRAENNCKGCTLTIIGGYKIALPNDAKSKWFNQNATMTRIGYTIQMGDHGNHLTETTEWTARELKEYISLTEGQERPT